MYFLINKVTKTQKKIIYHFRELHYKINILGGTAMHGKMNSKN